MGLSAAVRRALRAAVLASAGGLVVAAGAAAAPWVVVADHDSAGATGSLFWLDLGSGRSYQVEPHRGGKVLSVRPLDQNLFVAIGRRQPAAWGHFLLGPIRTAGGQTPALLLAETDSGYMAVLTRLGKGSQLGEVATVSGRPGGALAGDDGDFALLMRRDGNGRTDMAYLLHGGDGACLRLRDLHRLGEEPPSAPCERLPRFAAASEPVPVESPDGATLAFLLVTEPRGTILRIAPTADRDDQLTATATGLHLEDVFPAGAAGEEVAAPARRFALAPVRSASSGTRSVLAVDSLSGRLALLGGLGDATPSARLLGPELGNDFPERDRSLAVVPRVSSSGGTLGVWVMDPEGGRVVLVEDLEAEGGARVVAVEVRRQ
jgi:hypothetical protein